MISRSVYVLFAGPVNEKVDVTGPPVLMTSFPVSSVSHLQTADHFFPSISTNGYFFSGVSSFFSGSAARARPAESATTARAARSDHNPAHSGFQYSHGYTPAQGRDW